MAILNFRKKEDIGLQNEYIQKADELSEIIEKFFGKKVRNVTPCVAENSGFPWFKVTFVMYRSYKIAYEYERGYFSIYLDQGCSSGLVLNFSKENRQKIDSKNSDKKAIEHNLKILDEELRLRLPDKFLAQFD